MFNDIGFVSVLVRSLCGQFNTNVQL